LPQLGKKVFRHKKRRCHPRMMQYTIADLAQQAGVKMTIRALRRGFGCYWASRVPAQVLQKLMRHSSIALTQEGIRLLLGKPGSGAGDAQRLQMRQELSLPILEQFHEWLLAQRLEVLPKSPMGEAIAYALNNWVALVRYTEAGFLAIDNNVAEREMKRIAIGRKNWLTVGSPRGGQTAFTIRIDELN
jgi:hypothetical protein